MKNNFSVKLMKEKNVVIQGCVSLDVKKEKLLVGNYTENWIKRIGKK